MESRESPSRRLTRYTSVSDNELAVAHRLIRTACQQVRVREIRSGNKGTPTQLTRRGTDTERRFWMGGSDWKLKGMRFCVTQSHRGVTGGWRWGGGSGEVNYLPDLPLSSSSATTARGTMSRRVTRTKRTATPSDGPVVIVHGLLRYDVAFPTTQARTPPVEAKATGTLLPPPPRLELCSTSQRSTALSTHTA